MQATQVLPHQTRRSMFLYNNICEQLKFSSYRMYADDTVLYSSAPSLDEVYTNRLILSDCSSLVLNAGKTNVMLSEALNIETLEGDSIQVADSYKNPGI